MLAARAGLVSGLPLMHRPLTFRLSPGRGGGRAVRSLFPLEGGVGLRIRRFMALMPAVLGVTGADITAGDVWVATGTDGQIAGVLAVAPGGEPGALDLNKLFVEPHHIRSGVGWALLAHAVAERLTILADPNAAGFYERNGAVRIGEAPSIETSGLTWAADPKR